MTEFAILNESNEVVIAAWFPTASEAVKRMKQELLFATEILHVGQVCPDHDEAGRDGCKYCAAKATAPSRIHFWGGEL